MTGPPTQNTAQSVDDTELGGVLADTAGIHPGIDLIRDGIHLLATDHLSINQTQVIIAALAGAPDSTDILAALGLLSAHLTNTETNPAIRSLSPAAQKTAHHHGELTAYNLLDPDLRTTTTAACTALAA